MVLLQRVEIKFATINQDVIDNRFFCLNIFVMEFYCKQYLFIFALNSHSLQYQVVYQN